MNKAEIDSKCLYLAKQFLDEDVYEKFKRNVLDPEVSRHRRAELAASERCGSHHVIDRSFEWTSTPEGYGYWLIHFRKANRAVLLDGWYMGWDEDNFDDLDLSLDI